MSDDQSELEALRKRVEALEKKIAATPALAERRPRFETTSGVPLARVYIPTALGAGGYDAKLGLPGEHPFTRGIQPTMYRGKLWTMRQYAGFGDAAESNRRYKLLLAKGTTGLSIAFDLPTQMGRDSDHPMAEGEVGKVGVAIDSLDDMARLFDGIPLDQVSTSMTINSTATILLSLYAEVAAKQGVPGSKLRGTVQNDILKEYMARGTYIYPPAPSMRIITDLFAYSKVEWPEWNTISISGYHIREAGSTAAQEIAFTLADGIAYVESAQKAGLAVDDIAPQLSFFFNAHNNFLEEVAKFRAARRMWAKIMRERFGAKSPKSQMLRFHTQTAGSTLTAQQPDVNIVRVAFQALAAVLGGTQSLHTNSRDEALALPSEHAATIALRTQQIIGYETGVTDVIDPLGGSWAIEALTDELEARATGYIQKIDQMGGMVRAIEEGYPQREIEDASYRAQKAIESGEQVIVGVNQFQQKETPPTDLLKVDPRLEVEQKARLAAMKKARDGQAAAEACRAVEACAKTSDNLLPKIRAAVRASATVGEVADAMRNVFGEYRPTSAF
ncbi:methylmalonyl-CoA mutase family protein [Myxococcota bacterium]|nr:methylmalonyl-CoA mutase family protein [Myxococcota bacterium]